MTQIVRRGYISQDEIEFGTKWKNELNRAANDLYYFLNQGYDIKSSSNFIGNHFMLSQRQRLALARIVSSENQLIIRRNKELSEDNLMKKLYIDGFNTIITLEVALSKSLLIKGMDGCIRDLAGLRGNYHIVDKTEQSVNLILKSLDEYRIEEAVIYMDKPVSNSGRLKGLIQKMAESYNVDVSIEIINDVDSELEKLEGVISSDSVILDKCISWFNLNRTIINKYMKEPWIFEIDCNKI